MRILWGNENAAADIALRWAGNINPDESAGIRIINEGQADDDIALAWQQFIPDADTLALWHMNEPSWSGNAGEVEDATGNGHDGTAVNGANTTSGWYDRCGSFTRSSSQHVTFGTILDPLPDPITIEGWIRLAAIPANAAARMPIIMQSDSGWYRSRWCVAVKGDTGNIYFFLRDTSGSQYGCGTATLTPGNWYHFAAIRDGTNIHLYVNGVLDDSKPDVGTVSSGKTTRLAAGWMYHPTGWYWEYFDGLIDEVRISDIVRYTSDFSPHRYESGSVVCQYQLSSPQTLTSIDWDGTFGDAYGRVRRVYVKQGANWVAVGTEYPTPPLTGLQYTVSGPDLVKVELEPRQDTLQSETPILDWLAVTLQSAYAPKYPLCARARQRRLGGRISQRGLGGILRQRSLNGEMA